MYSSGYEMKQSKSVGYERTNCELLQVWDQVCERIWFRLIHSVRRELLMVYVTNKLYQIYLRK